MVEASVATMLKGARKKASVDVKREGLKGKAD